MPQRFATIDIGTNSTLLLVAERGPDGRLVPVVERIEITRLGRGVDRTRRLSPEALSETLSAIGSFAREARERGCSEVWATATSAARDSENGHELVEGARALGVTVEIISGEREAQLSWMAVASEFLRPGGGLAVIDIGGGSTEFIVGTGDTFSMRHSFDVGSVRMTERLVRGDPPEASSLVAVRATLRSTFASVPKASPTDRLVGIAGTFTTLRTISLGMTTYDVTRVHGAVMALEEIESIATRLGAMTLEERKQLPGLEPKRADVIVAGALVAAESVRALGASEVVIGDRGVRWGYLYAKAKSA